MPVNNFRVFVIDDDPIMRDMIKDFVLRKYSEASVRVFETGEDALEELFERPDVVVLDYHLDNDKTGALNGIEILKRIRELVPGAPVIFISAQDNPAIAEDTIKHGAYDFIIKNEQAFSRLEIMINNATGHLSLTKQLRLQKIFSTLLFIVLVLLIFIVLMLRMN